MCKEPISQTMGYSKDVETVVEEMARMINVNKNIRFKITSMESSKAGLCLDCYSRKGQ